MFSLHSVSSKLNDTIPQQNPGTQQPVCRVQQFMSLIRLQILKSRFLICYITPQFVPLPLAKAKYDDQHSMGEDEISLEFGVHNCVPHGSNIFH
jgi:hypothetical protein